MCPCFGMPRISGCFARNSGVWHEWERPLGAHVHQRLHRLIPGGHGSEVGGKLGQGDRRVDEMRGGDDAGFDQVKGFADGVGSVMEGGEEGEGGVVESGGVESDRGLGGAAAEEIDPAAFSDEVGCCFPDRGFSDGFEHGVEGTGAEVCALDTFGGAVDSDVVDAEGAGVVEAGAVASDEGDLAPVVTGEDGGHEADGAGAEDEEVLSGVESEVVDALDDAGEGFGEGGVGERGGIGDAMQVPLGNPGRDHDGLCVGAVEEEQVVAEVGLVASAGRAHAAGGGVGGDDTIADVPVGGCGVDFGDRAGELMAEGAGRGEHPGVVAASEDLEVGAAGEGGADPDADFAGLEGGFGDVLDPDIFLSVEHGGAHGVETSRTCGLRGKANFPQVLGPRWRR